MRNYYVQTIVLSFLFIVVKFCSLYSAAWIIYPLKQVQYSLNPIFRRGDISQLRQNNDLVGKCIFKSACIFLTLLRSIHFQASLINIHYFNVYLSNENHQKDELNGKNSVIQDIPGYRELNQNNLHPPLNEYQVHFKHCRILPNQ